MKMNEVYQLLEYFESSTLSEVEVEMDGVKVSAKKNTFDAGHVSAGMTTESVPVHKKSMGDGVKHGGSGKKITAPLVGIFYRASAPGEEPFIKEGQQIKKGDVIGIIEAMKLMNEITATEDGVVLSIEAKDGEMVEYGETLVNLG